MGTKTQQKRYKTLIIDPPWDIQQKGNYGAVNHYQLMTLEQIKAMPISDLMEEDGHVWLWVTAATLEHGYAILREWGLVPRSIFLWLKMKLGLGVYLRNCAEMCLLSTKGKSPILFKAQPNFGFFPTQGHSHKPEEFHEIVKRCSPGPYLELFARRRYPGFDVWGNEIVSDIDIPGYPVPDSPATRNSKNLDSKNLKPNLTKKGAVN
jgi:N6-adenosine-specific RNA methylase IME4